MGSSAIIGQIAGLLSLISFIPYLLSIIKGDTKPERATFAIWTVVSFILLLSYLASGATDTIWIPLAYTTFQTVVFILSFKYGMGGLNKLDIACLTGAVIGIILWIITKNPTTTLYISIFLEVLGFIPTFKKSYLYPKTENTLSWSIAAIASTLNLLAVTSFRPEIFLYPIYLFLSDGGMAILLLFPKLRLNRG